MTKILRAFAWVIVLTVLGGALPIIPASLQAKNLVSNLTTIKTAQASSPAPAFVQIAVQDENCSTQYQDYGRANYSGTVGLDVGYVTDSNAKDPECARINLSPDNVTPGGGGAVYTQDFRIGVRTAESNNGCMDRRSTQTQWTPWASEGGGESALAQPSNNTVEDADCIWIFYETRNIPNSAIILDAKFGISTGYGAVKYTPWATAGGGWSSWTQSGDFTTARAGLQVKLSYKYNANYISSTIPQYPPDSLSINQDYPGKNIVMKNVPDTGTSSAMPWLSDEEVSSSTNQGVSHCSQWVPSGSGQTCNQTTVYTSNTIKLRRIDSHTAEVQTNAGDLKYSRTVQSQWRSVEKYDDHCSLSLNKGGENSNLFGSLTKLLVHKAEAALPGAPPNPDPDCSPPTPYSPPQYRAQFISQDFNQNILTNETVSFEGVQVTGLVDGVYELQFQMVNLETGQLFGNPAQNPSTIAKITVRIGNGVPWSFNCGVDQFVTIGTDAHYSLSATVDSSFSNDITVTMSATPTGPALQTSPVYLISGSVPPYTNIATIPTTSLIANTTYTLTFTATDGSYTAPACQASLFVSSQRPTVDLFFNGSDGPTQPTPANGSTGQLSWTTSNSQTCTGSMTQGTDTTPGWSGSQSPANSPAPAGTFNVTGLQNNTTYKFKLTCTSSTGESEDDEVQVDVGPAQGPTADLQCQGTNGAKGFGDGPCTVNYNSAAILSWSSAYAGSCTLTPDFGSVATNEATGQNTPNLTANRTYTLTCSAPVKGFSNAVDTVEILVANEPPVIPGNIQVSNNNCGVIDISWVNTPGSPQPEQFQVYRNNTGNDVDFVEIISDIPYVPDDFFPHTYSFQDTSPAGGSNYYALAAFNGTTQSPYVYANIYPIAPKPCAVNLGSSDKDVISVTGRISMTFSGAVPCSGVSEIATLPNRALFAVGDVVNFKLSVCNTGSLALTGGQVTDTYTNLTNLTFTGSNPPSCVTGSSSGAGSMSFNLADIAPVNGVCAINISGTVTAPAVSTAAVYRFQNRALITGNSGTVTKEVYTPPYLFSVGGEVPDRTETAP